MKIIEKTGVRLLGHYLHPAPECPNKLKQILQFSCLAKLPKGMLAHWVMKVTYENWDFEKEWAEANNKAIGARLTKSRREVLDGFFSGEYPSPDDYSFHLEDFYTSDDESKTSNQSWATFLDQLPNEYIPIPWLIDGLIRVGERSDMYGQAGAGKTYLALDMGFSIAQGKPWMGRNTLQGLVLYIASENPQSVEARMKGFKTHYNYNGDALCIYKKPFDLFNSDKDSDDLIEFIDTASNTKGKPFRLIIFDTLSKVMVGANENLTADMNRVMAKIDRVIANAQAHCMVLHHSGKDESKGARGSNSLLGAIDTELRVQRLQSTRYIEVTKQRDGEDGTKIGFDLQSTLLKDQDGNPILNEKGEPLNIAIIVAKDSPTTLAKSTRVNKIEKAILGDLENTEGLNRTQFVKAIANKVGHSKTNHVYKKLAYLISIGKVIQTEKDGELWVSLPTLT
jgi:hypothetical protein